MAIQILGLRSFDDERGERKTYDAFFDKGWTVPDLAALFASSSFILPEIPEAERWNLFYTVADCGAGKREFRSTCHVAFDLDGVDEDKRERAADLAIAALGLSALRTVVVSSGGGVHLIIRLQAPVSDKAWFKENKLAYGECCRKIEAALREAGISCKADPTIFEPRRILRLPLTINRKPNKPDRKCMILRGTLEPQAFDLAAFSPTGKLSKESSLPKHALKKFNRTDTKAVLEGCEFLKWAKAEAGAVTEPQWYAALSVVARLSEVDGKTGAQFCHELSEGHPGYTAEETDRKIEQATQASGPRLCDNIQGLWGKCGGCPHWTKISTPLAITGPDTIPTELSGFHRISGNGKATPAVGDLRRYFERERHYRSVAKSRVVLAWNDKHYEELANNELEEYAFSKFAPEVKTSVMKEFRDLITSTRIVKTEWFNNSTRGFVSFENGTLNVKTGEFGPHSKEQGFRSVLPYDYEPGAGCPRFKAMLGKVTQGDKKLQEILIEFMGHAVSGDDCWTQKALVLEGDGSNGKSTFLEVLYGLVGARSVSSCSLKELDDEYARALFDGKLLNISDETPSRSLMDSSYFKAMVAGNPTNARSPYQEPFTLHNRAKFIFSCAELPQTFDTSFGLLRRLLVVPFNALITVKDPDFDPHLGRKLKEELPGIFNLALEGYRRLVRQGGFTQSDASAGRIAAYESSVNTVKSWFKDEATVLNNGSATAFTPIQDLFDAYRQWARSRETKPVTYDKYCKDLARIVPDFKARSQRRRWPEGGRDRNPKMGLVGIGLLREHGEQEEHEIAQETSAPAAAPAEAEFLL